MSYLGAVAYDTREVSLLRLLPRHREAEFRAFVHPLRRRAATVLAVVQFLYIIAELLVLAFVNNRAITASNSVTRIANVILNGILLFVSIKGTARQIEVATHGWFVLSIVIRYIQILVVYVRESRVSVTTVMVFAMYWLLMDVAVGTTMHIHFLMFFLLSTISFTLTMGAMTRAFLDDGGLGMTKAQLITIAVAVYLFAMWSVHTVQYNTVMMFVWNKKYIREQVEIGKRKHIEELNRLHVSNALHDIGSPLQAFVNGLHEIGELLQGYDIEPATKADIKEAMDWMQYSVSVMSFAREQAIAYAKALWQMEEIRPKFIEFDLREMVHECLTMMKGYGRFRAVDVPIYEDIDEAIPQFIRTDRTCVWESLTNYLSNAVKFTNEGFILVKISLRPLPPLPDTNQAIAGLAINERMGIHIEVADTGRGFPAGGEDLLFKPFSQLQSDSGGTGLGLVSVKTKVEMLNGSVGVRKNEPNGAIFWCDIPIDNRTRAASSTFSEGVELMVNRSRSRNAHEHEPSQEIAPPASQATAIELMEQHRIEPSKVRLLLVEDERMLLKYALRVFTNLGFSVETASDGRTALDMLMKFDYDLVLMDQNMPNLGGLEVIRRFREWQQASLAVDTQSGTDVDVSKVDQSRTTSASTGSEMQTNRGLVKRGARLPITDAAIFNPLIFILSASVLQSDQEEAEELEIVEFFCKPLQVTSVPQKMISRLVVSPQRLQRVQRPVLSPGAA